MMRTCTFAGCGKQHYARGYCNMHWQRQRKFGDAESRFFARAQSGAPRAWLRANSKYEGDACLIWPFARRENGFPKMAGRSPARMMCELVRGPSPTPEHQVAHSCGKGHDGCLAPRHLRWATATENHADKRLHGTLLCGEQISCAKLTERAVREIRDMAKTISHAEIASQFGISRPTITRAVNRLTWKHIA